MHRIIAISVAVTVSGLLGVAHAKTEMVASRDARAWTRPTKKSDVAFRLHTDEVVVVVAKKKKWAQVQNRDGDRGWVRISALDELLELDDVDPGEPRDRSSAASEEVDVVDEGPSLSREQLKTVGLASRLRAAIGMSSYSRDFSSDGSGPLGGYKLSVGSMAAMVDGSLSYSAGRLFFAAVGRYSGAVAAPGVRYEGVDGMSAANRLVTHDVAGGLEIGLILGDESPARISAGVGYQLGYFVVDEIQDNPGLLARERLAGPTAEVSLVTAFGPRATVSLGLGVLLAGDLRQTANLEDGTESDVSGYGGSAGVAYLWRPGVSFGATYYGRKLSYEFTGQSRRQFDVTRAERTDAIHSLVVQAARSF